MSDTRLEAIRERLADGDYYDVGGACDDAAYLLALIAALQRERDELRSELDAIAALVSDRPEAGTYTKVEAAEAQVSRLTEALREALNEWEYAASYKGEHLSSKHGDAEHITELRRLLAVPPQEPQPG